MACLKEKFKSRTRINEFNRKKTNFMSLIYDWKYSKMKMEFIFALAERNLIKYTKEFAI